MNNEHIIFPESILSECTVQMEIKFASSPQMMWRKDLTDKQTLDIAGAFEEYAKNYVFLYPQMNCTGRIYDSYSRLNELRWIGYELWGTFDILNVCKAPQGYYISTMSDHFRIEPESRFGKAVPIAEFKEILHDLVSHISLNIL